MGGRAGEHREEGWQWKTLGLCEAVGRLGVPFKISPGQWDERRKWETKIKCHYDLSQVEQLLYVSLYLCLAYDKGSEAMYLSSMLTPSCLLCLIHDQNVSLHKHEAQCVMCMPVLWPFVWHMKALCIYYPSRSFKVSSTLTATTKFSRHHLEEQKSDPVVVLRVPKPSRRKPVCDTSGIIVVFLF